MTRLATGFRWRTLASLSALAIVVVLPAGRAAAQDDPPEPAVDCKKAISTPEIALCADRDYQTADRRLNLAYRAVAASIEKTDVPPEARVEWHKALVDAQRRWVAFRDAECDLTGYEWYGGTGRQAAMTTCMTALTDERTKALRLHADPH